MITFYIGHDAESGDWKWSISKSHLSILVWVRGKPCNLRHLVCAWFFHTCSCGELWSVGKPHLHIDGRHCPLPGSHSAVPAGSPEESCTKTSSGRGNSHSSRFSQHPSNDRPTTTYNRYITIIATQTFLKQACHMWWFFTFFCRFRGSIAGSTRCGSTGTVWDHSLVCFLSPIIIIIIINHYA